MPKNSHPDKKKNLTWNPPPSIIHHTPSTTVRHKNLIVKIKNKKRLKLKSKNHFLEKHIKKKQTLMRANRG